MKRIIIILVIAFLCTGLMQAQTKILGRKVFDRGIQSHTFIPKGQWMVGSTFSYSEHEDDNYKFLVLEKIESTGYTFKVSPFFGYFIRDNVALGGRFSYNRTYTDLGNISLDLDDFKKIPIRVGVAYGIEKKDCILGVLRGEYINVLITDEEVAQYLVDIKE